MEKGTKKAIGYLIGGLLIVAFLVLIIALVADYMGWNKKRPGPTGNPNPGNNNNNPPATYPIQAGSSGPAVSQLQQAINTYIGNVNPAIFTNNGLPYPIPVTGTMDTTTMAAMQVVTGMVYVEGVWNGNSTAQINNATQYNVLIQQLNS